MAGAGSGAAEPMESGPVDAAPSPLPAFAVPDKRRRLRIPAARRLLKPAADLGRAVRMLPGERAALEHALDRLGHVEPTAAHGRVQRHDAMRAQPQHQLGRLVAGEIVPHQQKPQRRQILRQGKRQRQSRLPHVPRRVREDGISDGAGAGNSARIALRRSRSHGCSTAFVQRSADCSRTWPEAGWNRVRILVVPPRIYSCGCLAGRAARLPRHTRMRHRLERTGLVLTPDRESQLRAGCVGLLDQLFLAAASGSLTRTTPCLRLPQRHAGFAPGAALLPAQARLVQGAGDGEPAHPRQAIRGPAQGLLQQAQRPGGACHPARARALAPTRPGCAAAPEPHSGCVARRHGAGARPPVPRG